MLAVFGIESDGLNLAVNLLILFLVVIYLALAYWTYADARRRISDPMIVGCCTLASLLFPFVGTVVYMIVRPPEYLDDVRERELEIRAMERRLGADRTCPYCRNPAEAAFLSCPHCGTKLKDACVRCKAPLEPTWRLCPYCETEVVALPPPPPTRRGSPISRSRTEA